MRSLTLHLRHTEAHGQLPFHPDCPICRQLRLHGTIQTGGIGSPRVRAAVAAGLIAVSTAAPPATALAQDGSTPVSADTGGDPANNPDADPGGDATDLPDSPAPAPATDPPSDVGAPVDQPPTSDPVVDPGDGSDPSDAASPAPGPSPTSPTATPTPEAAPTPAAAQIPSPPATPTPTPTTNPVPAATRAPAPTRRPTPPAPDARAHRPKVHSERTASAVAVPVRTPSPAPTVGSSHAVKPAPPQVVEAGTSRAPAAEGRAARPGDWTHVVRAGESLWVIANDVLGGDAGPARVAREVQRLWTLNRERIGTGNPSLLMIGTRLALR